MSDDSKTKMNWRKLLLIASLGLNLLVIGTIAGFALKGGHDDTKGGKAPRHALGALSSLSRALPEEQRKALRSEFRGMRSSFKANREKMRAADDAVMAVVTAPEFDRAAFLAAVTSRGEIIQATTVKGYGLFADALESMTLEERQAFAEDVKTLRPKGPRAGGKYKEKKN